MTDRIDTTVEPYRGEPQPCMRAVTMSPGHAPGMGTEPFRTCKVAVQFYVWDSLVCRDHAEERLVELLEAAVAAGIEPEREVPAA